MEPTAAARQPREDRAALGLVMMVVALACFTGVDTTAKWLMLGGLPALQVAFCRYAGHFVGALFAFLPSEGLSAFRSHRPGLQALRAACILGSTLLNFMALRYLPITLTTTVFFASPIVISLLSIPVLGEKVGIRRLVAVLVGFCGVLVVMQPWGHKLDPAIFYSFGALLSASTYFVLTRLVAGQDSNATSQLWTSGLGTISLLPLMPALWVWPEQFSSYVWMIMIGLMAGFGHSVATVAHRFADASLLAPVVYVQLLFATLTGIFLFNTPPNRWTLIGGCIIIASGLYIGWRERAVIRGR